MLSLYTHTRIIKFLFRGNAEVVAILVLVAVLDAVKAAEHVLIAV